MLTRIKRITSHVGHARFLAECTPDPDGSGAALCIGVIDRQADIPSPYRYSPEWSVYEWVRTVRGCTLHIPVVIVETAHKRYDVFHVPRAMIRPWDGEPR